MPRTKTGITRHRRHKKVLKLAKGFRGTNNRLFKRAQEAVLHAGQYAYIGRRLRKRDMRRLWITRLSAGLKAVDSTIQYSRFINAMKKAQVVLDRKIMSDLAATDFNTFKAIVQKVQA